MSIWFCLYQQLLVSAHQLSSELYG
jgi:hypothetical protein